MNSFLDRQTRPIGKAGRKSETSLAKRLGAKLTPASGAATAKGDMVLGDVLLEAKSTSAESLGLKRDWLLKIGHEAMMTGRVPALAITFTDKAGTAIRDGSWVLIPEEAFKRLSAGMKDEGES
jgi:hypothetical protein